MLTPEEHQKVVQILQREPSHTEEGIFTVMWSEHCSYKSSRIHLKKLPTAGRHVDTGAGRECRASSDIGDGWACGVQDRVA